MLKTLSLAIAITVVLVSMPTAQDAKAVITAASQAMGADICARSNTRGMATTSCSVRPTARARRGRGSSTRATSASSTSRYPPRVWTACASRVRTRRAAAASSRSAVSSRNADDHRRRKYTVGAAARNLDDAMRLPQSRGHQQRDDARADHRGTKYRWSRSPARTRPRSTVTSTARTWSRRSRPGSTMRSSATCRSRRCIPTTRTSAA